MQTNEWDAHHVDKRMSTYLESHLIHITPGLHAWPSMPFALHGFMAHYLSLLVKRSNKKVKRLFLVATLVICNAEGSWPPDAAFRQRRRIAPDAFRQCFSRR